MTIALNELAEGLVLFLNAGQLAKAAETELIVRPGREDHKVSRPFLLLERRDNDRWFIAPLFSSQGDESEQLDEQLKEGDPHGWIGHQSYFSPFQQWIATPQDIIAASGPDRSIQGNRRFYGRAAPAALRRLVELSLRNDAAPPRRE